MKTDQFEDLKQFIDARISQSETRTDVRIGALKLKMEAGFKGLAEVIEEFATHFDDRLTKLEQ